MAKFLTTNDIASEIAKIINKAKDNTRVTLISPYIQVPENLLQDMKDAGRRNVRITLVYGKEELKPEVRSQLEPLDNLSLRFLDNLHAKCFFNEECMVITSLNLYNYSEKNREMGVLISAKDDPHLYNEAAEEAMKIVKLAKEIKRGSSWYDRARALGKLVVDSVTEEEPQGFCIRCGKRIPYDEEAPYCRGCVSKWRKGGGNPTYRERNGHCHACGNPATPTKQNPLCKDCSPKSRR